MTLTGKVPVEEIITVTVLKRFKGANQATDLCMNILLREGKYDKWERLAFEDILARTLLHEARRYGEIPEEIRVNVTLLPIEMVEMDAQRKPKDRHLRFITPWEFLALGCTHPDLQRQGPIILPSTRVCLSGSEYSRELRLYIPQRIIYGWQPYKGCRYPVVLQD